MRASPPRTATRRVLPPSPPPPPPPPPPLRRPALPSVRQSCGQGATILWPGGGTLFSLSRGPRRGGPAGGGGAAGRGGGRPEPRGGGGARARARGRARRGVEARAGRWPLSEALCSDKHVTCFTVWLHLPEREEWAVLLCVLHGSEEASGCGRAQRFCTSTGTSLAQICSRGCRARMTWISPSRPTITSAASGKEL